MKKHLFNTVILLLCAITGTAEAHPQPERLATAIYWAEGGARARVPYGVLSLPVRDADHARQITLNSIRNNWRRWEQAGRPGDFIQFMGLRWCPPSVDAAGHTNWVRNVTRIYHGKIK